MRTFRERVYAIVARIPAGRVVTYGQIAAALGCPRAARQVGWAMHSCPGGLPWHRVVSSSGEISLPGRGGEIQCSLLRKEGIVFIEGRVDLIRHLWTIEVEDECGASKAAQRG